MFVTALKCTLSIFGVILILLVLSKVIRWFLQRRWGSVDKTNEVSAKDKIVLITGATAGIGRATALEFARREAVVLLACIDKQSGEDAVKWIRERTSLGQTICLELDLASLQSIRRFCKQFQAKYDQLHILINNAGVFLSPEEERNTLEGFEMHMGVNYLGHFLLTNLLLEQLKNGAPSRIVHVSSTAHNFVTLDLDDMMSEKDRFATTFLVPNLYSRSKLAIMLFNKELAKRVKGSGVRTYALCPGPSHTEIHQNMQGTFWWILKHLTPILSFMAKTPKQGAATTMYCALSKDLVNESGEAYQNCRYWDPMDRAVLKEADAEKLWEISTKLVGL